MKKGLILLFLLIKLSCCLQYTNELKNIWSEKTEEELQEILDKVAHTAPNLI